MASEILRENLIQKINTCISIAKKANLVNHSGLAGEIREILVNNLLNDILPEGFRIGSGKITDSNGNLSSQSDIIIYNREKYPPLLFNNSTGIFPIESVYYVIEVKTTVNSTELASSIEKANKLNKLIGPIPHFVLFSFNSDLKSKESEIKRFIEFPQNDIPSLNIYCVVEKVYCYFGYEKWNIFGNTNDRNEVVGLIIGILNTLVNKKSTMLDPGAYFMPN